MNYKIIIQKLTPREKIEDRFSKIGLEERFYEEVVFDAIVGAEEVIELMRCGYYLKEKVEKSAQKQARPKVEY